MSNALPDARFRPEIQGLRTIAAVLVAAYHLWFDRVSGGVDVFFVVSGFLITGSLVRRVGADKAVMLRAYLARLARRLLPAAYLVIVVTLVGSAAIISRVYWREIVLDATAAATYVSNWRFAFGAVDYLAQGTPQSPLLHTWALAVQGQFFLLWPLLIIAVAMVARRRGWPVTTVAVVAIAIVLATSLLWSLVATARDQPFAYFDTRARLWEFALGGLVALLGHRIRLPRHVRRLVGWVGLVTLVATGFLFDVGASFPGAVALLPTGAAVLVLLSGTVTSDDAPWVLRAGPMIRLGDVSYAFFLWHWPLYILTRSASSVPRLDVLPGTAVLLVSLGLAVLTTRWLETPIRRRRTGRQRPATHRVEVAVALAVPLGLVALTVWHGTTVERLDGTQVTLGLGDVVPAVPTPTPDPEPAVPTPPLVVDLGPDHPGAAAFEGVPASATPEDLVDPTVPLIPPLDSARADRPAPYDLGCHQLQEPDEVVWCDFGDTDGDVTIALVGGSHSAHWQPALTAIAEVRGWHLRYATKSACRFGLVPEPDDPCTRWGADLLDQLVELAPDAVFVTSTVVETDGSERVQRAAMAAWRELGAAGVEVVAIRDNPRYDFQIPECVEQHGSTAPECVRSHPQMLPAIPATRLVEDQLPSTVHLMDLTDSLCLVDTCPVVAGNVLIYRDDHHLSVPYSLSLAPALERELFRVRAELFSSSVGQGPDRPHAVGSGRPTPR